MAKKNDSNDKLVLNRLAFIDDSVDEIEDVANIQEDVFEALKLLILKELDLDKDGNIKRSRKNQRSAQKFNKIRNVVLTPEYKEKVGNFLGAFDEVKTMSDEQITDI